MSIITDAHGKLLGAVQGHSMSEHKGGVEASVAFEPGHQVHQVEVDDDMDTITDPDVFQQRLKQHLTKP
ncbi:hypothetical protein [Rugamonas sp.]|uniref:hypothetical protein n=1 Tax=Rugamonas sp. TaxID=1926287 RepID=UPI0025F8BE9A|nr:hypothetical protein [Rugamonas sp.]